MIGPSATGVMKLDLKTLKPVGYKTRSYMVWARCCFPQHHNLFKISFMSPKFTRMFYCFWCNFLENFNAIQQELWVIL